MSQALSLAEKLTAEVFDLGSNGPDERCGRLQFMVGQYAVDERPAGGMNRDAFHRFAERVIANFQAPEGGPDARIDALLEAFDEAAQWHGWAADQGTRDQPKQAKAAYEAAKEALRAALAAQPVAGFVPLADYIAKSEAIPGRAAALARARDAHPAPAEGAGLTTTGDTNGRCDGLRPALHGGLALGGYTPGALADLLFASHDVMSLNAELDLTMDQLVRLAQALSKAVSKPEPKGTEPDDKALMQALEERDAASDYIDALLDEVLGADRHEWTSAYGHADAMAEVRERMSSLLQPMVDKAWGRFEAAIQAPAPAPDDKALTQALEERDAASDYIDALLDEVLGRDRHEWTSNYGHADAMAEVRERMSSLLQPMVDKVGAEDDMLEPLIYAAIMHNGAPKTVAEFERAAANVAGMLKRRPAVEPVRAIAHKENGGWTVRIGNMRVGRWEYQGLMADREATGCANRINAELDGKTVAAFGCERETLGGQKCWQGWCGGDGCAVSFKPPVHGTGDGND